MKITATLDEKTGIAHLTTEGMKGKSWIRQTDFIKAVAGGLNGLYADAMENGADCDGDVVVAGRKKPSKVVNFPVVS